MTIAPAIAVYIGTDEQTVAAFLTAILTFVLAIIDAKYPNNFNDKPVAEESEILNDEYVTGEEDDI